MKKNIILAPPKPSEACENQLRIVKKCKMKEKQESAHEEKDKNEQRDESVQKNKSEKSGKSCE